MIVIGPDFKAMVLSLRYLCKDKDFDPNMAYVVDCGLNYAFFASYISHSFVDECIGIPSCVAFVSFKHVNEEQKERPPLFCGK